MIKLLIFGASKAGEKVLNILNYEKVEVLAFVDNDKNKIGKNLNGIKIISPSIIYRYDYDYIFIASMFIIEIYNQLIDIGIDENNLVSYEINLDIMQKIFKKISKKDLISACYKRITGENLDLINPKTFNEKLQWLKLNWYDPLASKCADKYEVREIIKKKIGKGYLNELIAVYNSVDEIDISKLPDRFVLKATHGSGYNIICENKLDVDWEEELKKMRVWLKTTYGWSAGEWVYKDIRPRIICEKYLEDESGELCDYKIFCFGGEPKFIQVDFNRFTGHKRNIYDLDWNILKGVEIKYPQDSKHEIKKPEKLGEMLELSTILSKDFPHVRVDFYIVGNKIFFGELTFFHGSGMQKITPKEFEIKMGNWLRLPNKF